MSQMRRELLHCQVGDAAIQLNGELNGELTSALNSDAATVRQRYCLPADFVGFSGHFPGHPIVPAVVQVFMAQLVAEQHFAISLPISGVERAKFHRQLKPLDVIDVQCQRKEIRGKAIIDAQLFVADDLVASFWLFSDSNGTKG